MPRKNSVWRGGAIGALMGAGGRAQRSLRARRVLQLSSDLSAAEKLKQAQAVLKAASRLKSKLTRKTESAEEAQRRRAFERRVARDRARLEALAETEGRRLEAEKQKRRAKSMSQFSLTGACQV